jgi:hypothetical protein
VLYLANPSTQLVRDAMAQGLIGCMDTPRQGNRPVPGAWWAADNGCFGKGYPGDAAWFEWLRNHTGDRSKCLFAVAPDVVADAEATMARSLPWLPKIRALGYPAAFVAQNGLENLDVPWGAFDVLFIGGTTEWKLGPHAARIAREAKARGIRVHMGRVNSARRFGYAQLIGCDTADGTYIAFGPDNNLPDVIAWGSDLLTELAHGGAA